MRRLLFSLVGAITAAGGVFLAAEAAPGEECAMKLKQLASTSRYTPDEYQYRATYGQTVMGQFQDPSSGGRVRVQIGGSQATGQAFEKIVKKEPAKYGCKQPFRGVVKLGDQEFAFVFDAVGLKPDEDEARAKAEKAAAEAKEKAEKAAAEAKAKAAKEKAKPKSSLLDSLSRALTGEERTVPDAATPRQPGNAIMYNRLYFDRNRNGDLTDDPVIESETRNAMVYSSGRYARAQFPVVTVPLEAGGAKYDYAFSVNVTYNAMDDRSAYAYASFNAAAYRDGEITLDGKKRHLALVDFNSNGRYDDVISIRSGVRGSEGQVYPQYGDVLLVDPQASRPVYLNPYDVTSSGNRYNVSKLVSIDGKFYDLVISPSGDKLSLAPATPSIGYVTNPNDGFTAVVYSDKGFMKISGGKSKPVPLPEGSWKLLSYTIDLTGMEEKPAPAAEKSEKKDTAGQKQSDLLSAVVQALAGGAAASNPARPLRATMVSAQATNDYPPVVVRKGETATLPFGPPYKPTVKVNYSPGPGQVQLSMTLVGVGGERCSNMMVQGGRPSKPEFTISDPKGEVVYRGSFDYG